MTKARIREIRISLRTMQPTAATMVEELIREIEAFQVRARRGEDISTPSEELPLAAKVNPAKKARGTQQEILAYAGDIDLAEEDGWWFLEKMTENDWKVGKQPVKDWKGRMRQWKLMKIFPSQKNGTVAALAGPSRCIL